MAETEKDKVFVDVVNDYLGWLCVQNLYKVWVSLEAPNSRSGPSVCVLRFRTGITDEEKRLILNEANSFFSNQPNICFLANEHLIMIAAIRS